MVLKYMEMRKYIFTEGMKITGDCLILDYLQLPTWFFLVFFNYFFSNYFIRWDTSTSSQVSNCDGAVPEIYLDHKFQWPQEGLNSKSLAYEVVT